MQEQRKMLLRQERWLDQANQRSESARLRNWHYRNEQGTFSVSYWKALGNHMPHNHFHSTYEIFYLMSGKREFFIQDRTTVISAGDIVIISPNILHRTTNADMPKYERLIVNIHENVMIGMSGASMDILKPLFEQDYVILKSDQLDRPFLEGIAKQIMQEMQEKKPGFEMYAQTLVMQLLITCCRSMDQENASPPEFPSPMHARISEVVHYINTHYMDDLSLHSLADKFYVSPYYLSRSFKEATGFTFVEYLHHVRIKEAKKLLVQSSLKVNVIAKTVGFGSVTHFGRVFKQVTGHAPLFFRKSR